MKTITRSDGKYLGELKILNFDLFLLLSFRSTEIVQRFRAFQSRPSVLSEMEKVEDVFLLPKHQHQISISIQVLATTLTLYQCQTSR